MPQYTLDETCAQLKMDITAYMGYINEVLEKSWFIFPESREIITTKRNILNLYIKILSQTDGLYKEKIHLLQLLVYHHLEYLQTSTGSMGRLLEKTSTTTLNFVDKLKETLGIGAGPSTKTCPVNEPKVIDKAINELLPQLREMDASISQQYTDAKIPFSCMGFMEALIYASCTTDAKLFATLLQAMAKLGACIDLEENGINIVIRKQKIQLSDEWKRQDHARCYRVPKLSTPFAQQVRGEYAKFSRQQSGYFNGKRKGLRLNFHGIQPLPHNQLPGNYGLFGFDENASPQEKRAKVEQKGQNTRTSPGCATLLASIHLTGNNSQSQSSPI